MTHNTRAGESITGEPQNKYFQDDQDKSQVGRSFFRSVSESLSSPHIFKAISRQAPKLVEKTKEKFKVRLSFSKQSSKPSKSETTSNKSYEYKLPTYNTAIITNKEELDAILGNELKNNQKAKINYITDFNDLFEGGLISKHRLDKNSITGETDLVKENGSLFIESKDPVVLVIDYRNISTETIVEFNSLYDNPPTLNGCRLSSNVKIISVIDTELSNEEGPGSDFWRRVFATENFIDTNGAEYLEGEKLFSKICTQKIPESKAPDS